MLSNDMLEKKSMLEKIIKKANNRIELIGLLREKCDRIDIKDKNILLNFDKAVFEMNTEKKKIEKITTYDESINKIKEFLF